MTIPEAVVAPLLRVSGANRPFATEPGAKDHIARRQRRPQSWAPPRGLRRDVAVSHERFEGWPLYQVRPVDTAPDGAVVYLHGGGWVNEIVSQHWQLVAQIAAQARTTVFVPVYPLIPAGTAEEANRVGVAIARRVHARHRRVCLAGDSAGGQIALSAALSLRDAGVPVERTLLIAPALDLSLSHPDIPAVQPHDPLLGVDGTRVLIEHWRGDLPLDDARVSPLCADLTGLSPLTVMVGTHDILCPDARLLADRARAAGVEVDLHVKDGLVHVYPLLPTPSGRAARAEIVRSIRQALDGGRR